MANIVYIATSLDGYIATPDGGLGWLEEVPNPDGGDFGFSDFMKRVDAIVMGRLTYEKVLTFPEWPYEVPVFVMSRDPQVCPEGLEGKVSFLSGTPREVVAYLSGLGHKNLYIDGGRVIQAFLDEGLIDEMIVTRVPVLLGGGIPLFGRLRGMMRFHHVETEVIANHLVKSRYLKESRHG